MPKTTSRRHLSDWVEGFLEYTDKTESPISYLRWAAIAGLCGGLRRFTYFQRGHETIYPNNYIILVGPSGRSRKALPIGIIRQIAEKIPLKVLAEDNTPESVILEMSDAAQTFTDVSSGETKHCCSWLALCEELSVFTGEKNTRFLAYLTNWYDARDNWSRRTKHQGHNELYGVCPTILASTAPDWLPYILTAEAAGGGFTSRCLFIVEKKKRQTVPDPDEYPPNKRLFDSLVHDLERVMLLNGRFVFSPEAREAYTNWYAEYDKKVMEGDNPLQDSFFNNYLSRRATHAVKISMAISAGRRESLIIELSDFLTAVKYLEEAEEGMPGLFAAFGKSKIASDSVIIEEFILDKGKVGKEELLRAFGFNLDKLQVEAILSNLLAQGKITFLRSEPSGETFYIPKKSPSQETSLIV